MSDRESILKAEMLEKLLEAYTLQAARCFDYWDKYCLSRCESPIERLFAWAYLTLLESKSIAIRNDLGYGATELDFGALSGNGVEASTVQSARRLMLSGQNVTQVDYVFPQHQIGAYRADFLIKRFGYGYSHKLEREVIEVAGPLVVECDGHDYHDRTREQVARDKKRDREMVAGGIPVFRFSGSELFRNPSIAADEVDAYLKANKRVAGPLSLNPGEVDDV